MFSLQDLDDHASLYAVAREKLGVLLNALNAEVDSLKRRRLPAIREALSRTAQQEAFLRDLISESPDLFRRPRTQIMHGIKMGFQKGRGTLAWDDADAVVRRIERWFPETSDTLIKTTKTPIKAALSQLAAQDLKRLGCSLTEAGDEIVVKAIDSALDKMIDALLKDAVSQAQEG